MILITGATGLIGSHLTAKLLLQGKSVAALVRPSSDLKKIKEVISFYTETPDLYFNKLIFKEGDIKDIFSIEDALQDIEEVYHCAGMVSFNESLLKELLAINAFGTANVVNACIDAGVKKLCFVSSVATMPNHDKKEIVDETVFWKSSPDNSAYAISKYNAEREVWRGSEEGLNVVIVNPTVVIGAGCWGQSSGRVVEECYKGSAFYVEGATGFVDVRDVVTCMVDLMEKRVYGKRFVINGQNRSMHDVLNIFHDAFGKKRPTIKAGKFLLKTGGFFERIVSSDPKLTKATIDAALNSTQFSNHKIISELEHQFVPIEQTIKYVAEKYKEHIVAG